MALLDFGYSKNNSVSSWDDFWRRRGIETFNSWAKQRIIHILEDFVKEGIDILDAGCGSGFFSSYFISRGANVFSLDYSLESLRIAEINTRGNSKMYVKHDILDDRIIDRFDMKFDIIFTDGLLEHYSPVNQDKVIENLKSLKKEKGCIINFAPNRASLWSIVRQVFINIEERPFNPDEFMKLHIRNRLKIVGHGGINVLPFRLSPERLLGKYFGMLLYCIAI